MNQVQEYVQEKFIGGRIFRLIERYGIANGVPFYSIQKIIHHQIQGVFEEKIIKIYNLINGEYEFTYSISDCIIIHRVNLSVCGKKVGVQIIRVDISPLIVIDV